MLHKKGLYAIFLILVSCAVGLDAAPLNIQLVGWPLAESEPDDCVVALGVVGSSISGGSAVQVAPGCSISDTAGGLQVGGVVSICRRLSFLQLSTGFSICSENRGLQIAGVLNRCRLLTGRQIGIFNSAAEGDGLQVGVFNYVGEGSATSIGLINIRKTGLLRWLNSVDHNGDIVTGLQSGGEDLYTVIAYGVSDHSSSFAVGGQFQVGRFFSDIEAGVFIPADVETAQQVCSIARIRPGFSVTGAVHLFASVELRISKGYTSQALGSLGVAWGR